MTETTSPVPLTLASPVDQVFPTLTPAQIARLAAHGHVRQVQHGEVLAEAGEPLARFGYPFSPGHYVASTTYREGLMALPWQRQLIDLR
jgi:hypothetical protein